MTWLEHGIPKTCSRCGQTKTWADFPADPTTPTGYGYTCKTCRNAAARARYHQMPATERKRRREAKKRWQAYMNQLARENGWVKKQPTKGATDR